MLNAIKKTKQEKINDLFNITDIENDETSIFLRKLISKIKTEQCGMTANDDELTQKLLRCLPTSVSIPLRLVSVTLLPSLTL